MSPAVRGRPQPSSRRARGPGRALGLDAPPPSVHSPQCDGLPAGAPTESSARTSASESARPLGAQVASSNSRRLSRKWAAEEEWVTKGRRRCATQRIATAAADVPCAAAILATAGCATMFWRSPSTPPSTEYAWKTARCSRAHEVPQRIGAHSDVQHPRDDVRVHAPRLVADEAPQQRHAEVRDAMRARTAARDRRHHPAPQRARARALGGGVVAFLRQRRPVEQQQVDGRAAKLGGQRVRRTRDDRLAAAAVACSQRRVRGIVG